MLRILGVVFIFLGCQIFNTTTLHLKYKDAPKNSALKTAFTLNPPKIFFNAHFVPPFYQKEFKKAITQQIAYFLRDKKGFTLNISGNVFMAFEEGYKDFKAIKERLKKTIEPNANPKDVMRFLNLQASLILECVSPTACPFDTFLIPTALSVPVYYANRLGDNPSLFSQEDKSYHNALIKALNKAYYSLMQNLEERLNATENATWL
ncbi:neuraminyllactose-binding hemagglutinin family protein [Helicobacter pylori SouthAfrica20]|uniref:Neuraminyllactose-binding hemagglutinin family protein n=1 Tax=Helicobacter pylori SouthAfrica20 TaxID=1352356 RepID=T1U8E8_HELPX|nr:neuraminyllactose-binding hemagglutinin family protein [Helicobacter pylori SouthAfrica20]